MEDRLEASLARAAKLAEEMRRNKRGVVRKAPKQAAAANVDITAEVLDDTAPNKVKVKLNGTRRANGKGGSDTGGGEAATIAELDALCDKVNEQLNVLRSDSNEVFASYDRDFDELKHAVTRANGRIAEFNKSLVRFEEEFENLRPKQYVIKTEGVDEHLIGELATVQHYMFDKLVQAANMRAKSGDRHNILLKGPAGSGKSTAGVNLAKLLGMEFTYIGQTLMPHQIEGYVRQGDGVYQTTAFVEAFINGGVLMLEELDAWSPQATLVANVPLANGYMTLPDGRKVERHKDCIIIGCANTWGMGATSEYVGRNKLDAAFLDRFGVRMDWGYDMNLERVAAGNDEVVTNVQIARMNAQKAGIKVMISPRSSIVCADMVRGGFTMKEAFEMNFLSALDKAQRKTVLAGTEVE